MKIFKDYAQNLILGDTFYMCDESFFSQRGYCEAFDTCKLVLMDVKPKPFSPSLYTYECIMIAPDDSQITLRFHMSPKEHVMVEQPFPALDRPDEPATKIHFMPLDEFLKHITEALEMDDFEEEPDDEEEGENDET